MFINKAWSKLAIRSKSTVNVFLFFLIQTQNILDVLNQCHFDLSFTENKHTKIGIKEMKIHASYNIGICRFILSILKEQSHVSVQSNYIFQSIRLLSKKSIETLELLTRRKRNSS